MNVEEAYKRFAERYATGEVPWDDALPPPEVQALVAGLQPGRALDLGCGYGRASIYLAQQGWRVDGVDFVPQAIAEARSRAEAAGVSGQIQFHVASVSDLHFLQGPYDLAIDIGCMHAIPEEERPAYRDGLLRLLAPEAPYLLFARLRQEGENVEDGPRGLTEEAVRALFEPDFELKRVERGETHADESPPWPSAWYWFQKKGDEIRP